MQCSKPWWYFSKQFFNIIEKRIQDTDLRAHTLQCILKLNEVDTIHFQLKNLLTQNLKNFLVTSNIILAKNTAILLLQKFVCKILKRK